MERSLEARGDLVAPPAILLLAGALAMVAAYHACRVFELGHKSYGEAPILALTERMAAEPPSAAWRTGPPYTLSCYGPAFYWASGAVAQLGGWRHSIVPGRLVSVAAALFVAALIAVAAGGGARHVEVGLAGALIFLVSGPVSEWLPYARVDLLALAFAAIAYVAAQRGWGGAALPAIAVVAGSLAKPTIALAAAPITLHLLLNRQSRKALWFAVLVVGLGAASWATVEWTSDGYFLSAVLSGNRNPLSLWRGYRFGYEFLGSPLGVGACVTSIGLWIVSPQEFRRSLFSLGFLVSTAIATVLVCKRGSDLNYFLEPAMLGSLAIAVDGVPRLYAADARRANLALLFLTIILAAPVLREFRKNDALRQAAAPLRQAVGWAERSESHHAASHSLPRAHFEAVSRLLAGEPAHVGILADGQCVDMVLAAGCQPWVNDSYLYMLLTGNGTLDSTELIEQVRLGHIGWLFLHQPLEAHLQSVAHHSNLWPPEVLRCLAESFEPLPAPEGLFAYRRAQRASAKPEPEPR
ncbi:MAG TPA: hypothetical protein VF306_21515 [Pirellulales bacterium]